jgi:hypothetical protein
MIEAEIKPCVHRFRVAEIDHKVNNNHAGQRETPNNVYGKCSLSVRFTMRMHTFTCPV